MAPIDNGEEKIDRVTSEVSRAAGQAIARTTIRLSQDMTRKAVAQSLRAAATSLKWTMAAVQKPGGEVNMKEFAELSSRTGREVVSLDDKHVMKALESNLKQRGINYAIEREKVGGKTQYVLHVRGTDGQVVADSLERAANAVDAKRELKQSRKVGQDKPTQERPSGPGESDEPTQGKTAPKAAAPGEQPAPADNTLRLADHGAAPYQNEVGKSQSYFVTVENSHGAQKTFWGVDLDRAINDSGAKVGDAIDVQNIGSRPVTLPDGTDAHRNAWNIEVTEPARAPKQEQAGEPTEPTQERPSGPGESDEPTQGKTAPNEQPGESAPKVDDAAQTKPAVGEAQQQELKDPTPDQKTPVERKFVREPPPAAGRTKAETAQLQKQLRQAVKADADKLRAAAPKPAPKLDVPSRVTKR